MRIFCLLFLSLSFSPFVYAVPGSGGGSKTASGQSMSTGLMVLASSTVQGGQGPQGSTILTHTEYNYHGGWWSAGLFYQYDRQGTVQQDSAYGPKLEFNWQVFYLEMGYAMSVIRAFTDRAVAQETGDGYFLGLGVRFALGGKSGGQGGWFFQGSYKYRTQNIKKRDGTTLSEPIVQTDGYPLAGVGYRF